MKRSAAFTVQQQALNKAVDLFRAPPIDISVISGDYERISPQSSLENDGPITFRVEKGSGGYLDFNDSFLYLKAKIVKADGTAITTSDKVAPGNLFLHTLFQGMNVRLNDTIICNAMGLYPYQAWILKQLKSGTGLKESELTREGYYKETDPDDYKTTNTSFQKRLEQATGSKSIEYIGKICDGLFLQERYIPNNVAVSIELVKSDTKFCLSAEKEPTEKYKVQIEEILFYIRRRVLHPNLLRSIQQNFSRGKKCLYPLKTLYPIARPIREGTQNYITDTLFNGVVPEILYLGIVSENAFSGRFTKSPFNFKPYKLEKLVVTLDNVPVIYRSIQCNFKDSVKEYLLAYNTLFKASEGFATGNGISVEEYLNGNVLYVYDIQDSTTIHGPKNGDLRLEISFTDPLAEHAMVILLAQYESLVEIDRDGFVALRR